MCDERTDRAMRYHRHVARERARSATRRAVMIAAVSIMAWAVTLTILIVQ